MVVAHAVYDLFIALSRCTMYIHTTLVCDQVWNAVGGSRMLLVILHGALGRFLFQRLGQLGGGACRHVGSGLARGTPDICTKLHKHHLRC